MVSVIIPAYNEAATIGCKVAEVVGHPAVREVIVVDDGSEDRTAELAAARGARVITRHENGGKGAALAAGVREAREDVLLFLDADVTGHTHATLSRIIEPVQSGRYEMFVGIRARQTYWLNRLLHFFPIIGGERALTRALWEAVPATHKQGFQIEIAMNYTSKQFPKGMGFELLAGTTHHIKERKYGLLPGLVGRGRMILEVLGVSLRLYILGFLQAARSGSRPRSRHSDR